MSYYKKHIIIFSCVLILICIACIVIVIHQKNTHNADDFLDKGNGSYIDTLKKETITDFKHNKKYFETVKKFVISKTNKSIDQDSILINLEERDYESITNDEKVVEAFEFLADELKYIEVFTNVGENYSNIKFVRQHGSEMETEISIVFTNDPRFKYNDMFDMLDDCWYFYCWAGD